MIGLPNERFLRIAAELQEQRGIDIIADILLGSPNRIFLYTESLDPDHLVMRLVSGSLTNIGFDDVDEIDLETILDHFDEANKYAEVAGRNEYREQITKLLKAPAGEITVTFPICFGTRRFWINILINDILGHQGVRSIFITNLTDIMVAEELNFEKSHRDALTGLFNKYSLDYHYGLRSHFADFHVLYLDLDDFKIVNDRYGHVQGDLFLREFATILKSFHRHYSLFYRMGGDEFVGMFFATEDEIRRIAGEILERTRKIYLPGCATCPSVSIGIIRATVADNLIRKADEVMYQVKNNGKNHYRYEVESI